MANCICINTAATFDMLTLTGREKIKSYGNLSEMASEVFLEKFNDEFKLIPIAESDWLDCEAQIDGVKLIKDEKGNLNRIECYCELIDDWIPVFWIDAKGSGFMRQSGFFRYEDGYHKAIEIAQYLEAIIHVESENILFEPNVGILYDADELGEELMITLDELIDRKVYASNDVKKAIEELMEAKREKQSMKSKSEEVRVKSPLNKTMVTSVRKWWEFWK